MMNTQISGFRRHYTLFVLFLISAVSLIDRQVMGVVIEPIKAEFHVSDTQIGLLTGLAFALVYCLFAIPLGRFADRGHRRNLIGWCCAFWSVMAMLCGFASNFWTLALARIGVAVGESGSGAASMSMIADLYPPHQRSKAISVFMLGAPIGALLGMSLGAYIAYYHGWREAFIWMALPGIAAALLLRFTAAEPLRGLWEKAREARPAVPHESVMQVMRVAWASKTFVRIAIAGALLAFASYAFSIWSTAFLVRSHGLTLKDAGIIMGLAAGPGGHYRFTVQRLAECPSGPARQPLAIGRAYCRRIAGTADVDGLRAVPGWPPLGAGRVAGAAGNGIHVRHVGIRHVVDGTKLHRHCPTGST